MIEARHRREERMKLKVVLKNFNNKKKLSNNKNRNQEKSENQKPTN